MKTIKQRMALAIFLGAALITYAGVSGFTKAPGHTTKATPKTSTAFKPEKKAINGHLADIHQQQQEIAYLKEQQKQNRKDGNSNSETKSQLIKAKADLAREKQYLKADKADLMAQHQAVIDRKKDAVKADKETLRASRRELNKDLNKGNPVAVLHAQQIVNKQNTIKQNERALQSAKQERNGDLLAVNNRIKENDGQSAFVIAFENGFAKAQNLAMK